MRSDTRMRIRDHNQLTPREAEVMKLYNEGMRSKQIGEILGIARRTVDSILVKAKDKEKSNEQL